MTMIELTKGSNQWVNANHVATISENADGGVTIRMINELGRHWLQPEGEQTADDLIKSIVRDVNRALKKARTP